MQDITSLKLKVRINLALGHHCNFWSEKYCMSDVEFLLFSGGKKITILDLFAFSSVMLFVVLRFMPATCRVKCTCSNFISRLTEVELVLEWVVYHLVTF